MTARRRAWRKTASFMTTTTANAERVFRHMQFCHQVLWPGLDVQLVPATDQWAQFLDRGAARARDNACGARGSPLRYQANAAFPPMATAELTVCGRQRPRALYRISFSGELAFELGVPARYGDALARAALMQAGGGIRDCALRPPRRLA